MSIGRHHQSLRRRLYKNLEPYPHPQALKRLLDRIVFAVGFISPLCTLPQLYTIYVGGHAEGVSALTWGAYALFDVPWIAYGVVHKERPIIFAYSMWLIVNMLVAAGAVIFG